MKTTVIILISILTLIFACSNATNEKNADVSNKINVDFEVGHLSSEAELDNLVARGGDDVVDWQLSKEFCELWLEDAIFEGYFAADSVLYDIPITVYDGDGNIKYYEFRVMNNGEAVGTIVGAADKEYGCPVLYCNKNAGYSEELKDLYDNTLLDEGQTIRLVDNGYPTVALGAVDETKGDSMDFMGFIDIESGDSLNEVASYISFDEAYNNQEEYEIDIDWEAQKESIDQYKAEGKTFWEMAEANKGSIADFAVRGSSSKKSDEISSSCMNKYKNKVTRRKNNIIVNYVACGPCAAGFVLDFMAANDYKTGTWKYNGDYDKKKNSLYEQMKVEPMFGGEVTWPWNIGKSIIVYTSYQVSSSSQTYPKRSIANNLPGISLRIGKGGAHYRPVIEWKKIGWWAFSWPQIKVFDLVDNKSSNGSWETYIPLYHLQCYDVVKK